MQLLTWLRNDKEFGMAIVDFLIKGVDIDEQIK